MTKTGLRVQVDASSILPAGGRIAGWNKECAHYDLTVRHRDWNRHVWCDVWVSITGSGSTKVNLRIPKDGVWNNHNEILKYCRNNYTVQQGYDSVFGWFMDLPSVKKFIEEHV